jgi:NAD(P)H-flavin reductase
VVGVFGWSGSERPRLGGEHIAILGLGCGVVPRSAISRAMQYHVVILFITNRNATAVIDKAGDHLT